MTNQIMMNSVCSGITHGYQHAVFQSVSVDLGMCDTVNQKLHIQSTVTPLKIWRASWSHQEISTNYLLQQQYFCTKSLCWTLHEPLTAESCGFPAKQIETNVWEGRRNALSQEAHLKLCVWGGGFLTVFIFLELTYQTSDIPWHFLPNDLSLLTKTISNPFERWHQ